MASKRALIAAATVLLVSCTRTPIVESIPSPPPQPPPLAQVPSAAPAAKAIPRDPFTLSDEHARAIEVYPPVGTIARAPLLVFVHATCMQPSSVCDHFGTAARDRGWLVCPSGNTTCAGEPDWHGPGPEKAAFLASALAKVERELAGIVDDQHGVLIGWSRGAFAARDILYALHDGEDAKLSSLAGRFRGLVLIAAQVTPDVVKLKRLGIERVVMAAGDHDGATPTMKAAVNKLKSAGIEARFVSLGKIGHVWPVDFDARMAAPIAWAAGDP